MSTEGAGDVAAQTEEGQAAKPSSRLLKSGVDPRVAAARSAEVRREKREAREAAADHDSLTVQARWATSLAQHATKAEMDAVTRSLVKRAQGDGHVANGATSLLLAALKAAAPDDDAPDGLEGDPSTWNAAQRAAARVHFDRLAATLKAGEDEQGVTEMEGSVTSRPEGDSTA